MDYVDLYNIPENAIESYIPVGGEVSLDLFDGFILRVPATGSFNLERLSNQIDGAKFFVEIINNGDSAITLSFDSDYRGSNLGYLSPVSIAAGAIEYYEMICRLGLIIIYAQPEASTEPYLRNPSGGFILINPATGEPLLNPSLATRSWILADGTWNDDGLWDDDAVWVD